MTLPGALNHNRHRKIPFAKLSFLAILIMGVFFVQILLSFQGEEEQLQPHSHRLDLRDMPTARNGAIVRREHRSITEHDRQQDIHRYSTTEDKPRIVILSSSTVSSRSSRFVDTLSNYTAPTRAKSYIWDFEVPYFKKCTFMNEWQATFYPTCNTLHEVQAAELLSSKGSWRTAWMIENDEQVVLKMLNLERNFDIESFNYHQVDVMAMERLTKSKYSILSYGFCGQSVLVEYAPLEGRDLIKNKKLSKFGRLLLGRDLARGIRDIHSIDTPFSKNATFVHNDVNIANILATKNGRLKFSDFNIGYPLKWNKTKPCGYPQRWEGPLWRSPEEIHNATYVSEKTDVYSLGNLLFQVMTRHQPWTWLELNGRPTLNEIAKIKLQGATPFIPSNFVNSTDMSVQALYHAIQACFKQDPKKRATAFQVAHGLSKVVRWIEGGNTTMTLTEDLFFQK